jgi:hypothetical protein
MVTLLSCVDFLERVLKVSQKPGFSEKPGFPGPARTG